MRALLLSVLLLAGILYYMKTNLRAPERRTGVAVWNEPAQGAVAGIRTWNRADHVLTSLATYRIRGLVLGAERYWFDRGAKLAPVDLAIGWGRMSDRAILDRMSMSQGSRFYRYSYRHPFPLTPHEINSQSANMHMIPASAAVERRLKSVSAGDEVVASGYLVSALAADGGKWTSSLSRTDEGAGACELMWVEEIDVIK